MKTLLMLVAAAFVLASCQSADHVPFRQMSEQELIAYNTSVPLGDNVYCFEDVRTGSFIRRKYCLTLQEIVDQVNDSSHTLGVLNYGGPGPFRGGGVGIGVD
ncbi:MAG: hypothetical protein OXU66_08415 [Gammaproteobacteria bacterium]|nr:hypothetical protein [Gammaproteobacteria bacterium]MDD9895832.1 hypothetical protein [Gammaproteobacteria bacterium]MDD9958952.1 hypothetical protein [Gammaproteobacteria bacterium]